MKEYKDKSQEDLNKLISEKREALRHFRFGGAGGRTKNVKMGKITRKDIARIMTELSIRKHAK